MPGVSGNPRGRPKADFDLRDFARGFGRPAILSLAQLAGLTESPPATNEAVRVAALRELLDRGFGKATTVLAGDRELPLAVDFRWLGEGEESAQPTAEALPETDNDEGGEVTVVWAAE